ncbi:unnamed protein product [Clonostachys rosea]|uniref:Uncharacterized protein n=1 Tax=Bionectria ochroleuca TaxID=29856 RepID=A0ABY6U7Z4_BIOOC|nr:unnamed protein product [Clonostachys rosea]
MSDSNETPEPRKDKVQVYLTLCIESARARLEEYDALKSPATQDRDLLAEMQEEIDRRFLEIRGGEGEENLAQSTQMLIREQYETEVAQQASLLERENEFCGQLETLLEKFHSEQRAGSQETIALMVRTRDEPFMQVGPGLETTTSDDAGTFDVEAVSEQQPLATRPINSAPIKCRGYNIQPKASIQPKVSIQPKANIHLKVSIHPRINFIRIRMLK